MSGGSLFNGGRTMIIKKSGLNPAERKKLEMALDSLFGSVVASQMIEGIEVPSEMVRPAIDRKDEYRMAEALGIISK